MTNEELVQEIQNGVNTRENMQRLYDQNRGLIYEIIKPYAMARKDEFDDLLQEAYIGLHEAVKHFNPDQGVSFVTYAVYWIRHVAGHYCHNHGSVYRVPVHMQMLISRYNRFLGDNPAADDAAICEALGIDGKKLEKLRYAIFRTRLTSLDAPLKNVDSDEITVGDSIADGFDLESYAADRVDDAAECRVLWDQVETLTEKQRDTIKGRYVDGLTLQEIGNRRGITYQAAGNLEKLALNALRKNEEVRRIASDRGYDVDAVAYRGSVGRFKRTGTSATEAVAIRNVERQGGILRYLKFKADYAAMMSELQQKQT